MMGAPGLTVTAAVVTVGARTVMGLLLPNRVNPLLLNNRRSYGPGISGAVNCSTAPLTPLAGFVIEPFRYCQVRKLAFAADVRNNPIQSVALAGPPATVKLITAPGL